jgi:hypothetical protein
MSEQEADYRAKGNQTQKDAPTDRAKAKENEKLVPVVIDLTEGFKDDTVILQLGGQEAYHQSGVSTNWSVGIAASTTVEAVPGSTTLTVSVPTRKLIKAIKLVVLEPQFVVVAIVQDDIEISSHTTPPSTYF